MQFFAFNYEVNSSRDTSVELVAQCIIVITNLEWKVGI